MYTKLNITRNMFTVMCISIFALTAVPLTVNDSYAQGRDRRGGSITRESRETTRRDIQSPRRGGRVTRESRETTRRDIQSPRRGGRVTRESRVGNRRGIQSPRKGGLRSRRQVISPRIVRRGHVVNRLPRGYRRAWYNRTPYYYNHGAFYRPGRLGFTVVRPPRGLVVISLPIGYQRLWVGGSTYYTYGGTFYNRVPSGYVVVDPPPAVVVKDTTPELIQPANPASGQVIVDAPVLNVRSGPSLSDPKIYQVDEGYILEVHGRSNGWLYVQLPNGEYGWVKKVFTKPVSPASG